MTLPVLPAGPQPTYEIVQGHEGKMLFGMMGAGETGIPVVLLVGRAQYANDIFSPGTKYSFKIVVSTRDIPWIL